jgi:general nucleoside transport system ATP-binding protein
VHTPLLEKLELSFQSIMLHGKFVHEVRASEANFTEIGRHMAGH